MSVVNSFSAGTTIESGAVNANFTDFASEITNSLPRDGQAAMTGAMKAASGSVAAPGITFGSDPDTGFYRKAANTMGVVAGGVEVGSIGASGFADANGNPATAFPSGTKMLFVQTLAPTGWTKDTDHNNKALRIVSGTASSGGSSPFTSVFAARTLTQANLPNVNLSSANLAASSSSSASVSGGTVAGNWSQSWGSDGGGATGPANAVSISVSVSTTTTLSGTVPLGGSGTAVDFAVAYVDTIIATKD
jgi:hypothetical protein